ncbi:hypothetical protein Bcep22_gp19 [Burkholderia phage Bcep22]|uniref:Uncharacterized protein n=1 Tax=Burkholderia phage Bcep22 TaxID=2883944 RepID=Q6V7S5_9CAUD|nr:hypothetical protein Bcep22_gp19 [Burkholderia phage Bcep22]AAQ54953.1 hypothetical protein Bcep22_gp19 [Burkholderia phage Bcep22]
MSEGAVMGATGTIKTMADGTFRLVVDIEPRYAQQAFALFGAPGTPVALARLTSEAAVAQDRAQQQAAASPEPERPKGGPLARLAGQWCNDPDFWAWLRSHGRPCDNADDAAVIVRATCKIESRAELDSDDRAAHLFQEHIRSPFMLWRRREGR